MGSDPTSGQTPYVSNVDYTATGQMAKVVMNAGLVPVLPES